DDELFLMREITASGKSLCRINGEMVPLNVLHEVADSLVDIHGQHAHQSLLDPKNHMSMVDEFDSQEIPPLRDKVNGIAKEYRETEKRLNSGFVSASERERRIEILNFQINEIEKANLSEDEEKLISDEISLLSNAEKINDSLENAADLIGGERSSLNGLRLAADFMSKISGLSPDYEDIYSRLENLYYELEDCSYVLRDLRADFEYSPERLNELEIRLDYINSLKRKYGGSIKEILEFKENACKELDELVSSDEIRIKLSDKLNSLTEEYNKAANELTAHREKAASVLSERITNQLADLGMKQAVFAYSNNVSDERVKNNGNDSIEFMFSANTGEPCKPLSKIASGGEMSRIMLAIKTVCADADRIPTLIFDEIDTGISGITSIKVGEKMAKIAKSHQVVCITHLPQIAAFGDAHFLVEKSTVDSETHTNLRILSDSERRIELARIMGSTNPDDSAVKYADEMIKSAAAYKKRD
ncbi:MAG: DNA repair protein RecN, partial [Clostridiales bacterium]|nr:DNA repair protein RecN [Clostridiales bacterium]MDY5702705.1 DNA repair protein RecN [Eubacteriales bacterium]